MAKTAYQKFHRTLFIAYFRTVQAFSLAVSVTLAIVLSFVLKKDMTQFATVSGAVIGVIGILSGLCYQIAENHNSTSTQRDYRVIGYLLFYAIANLSPAIAVMYFKTLAAAKFNMPLLIYTLETMVFALSGIASALIFISFNKLYCLFIDIVAEDENVVRSDKNR